MTATAALGGLRVCDLTGQLAGAGATRFLAAFGAEVIRVEDPVRQGTWDILRGAPPFKDGARGIDAGGAFNNHNVKFWGPIVQAQCGLTAMSGLAGQPPAGSATPTWIIRGLLHGGSRPRVFPAAGDDAWVAIACRHDADWSALQAVVAAPWMDDPLLATVTGRAQRREEVDNRLGEWTSERARFEVSEALRRVGVPAAAVQRPSERMDDDEEARAWGLWPTVTHRKLGEVRVDGIPVHLSETDWVIQRGAPCLGEHNRQVFGDLLGLGDDELAELEAAGVL